MFNKALAASAAVFSILVLCACAVGNPAQTLTSQPGLQSPAQTVSPQQDVTTPVTGVSQPASTEKAPPAEPPKNFTQIEANNAPASQTDLDKAAEAYKKGDISLCDQIVSPELKKACQTNLQSQPATGTESARQSDFKSVVTTGTPSK